MHVYCINSPSLLLLRRHRLQMIPCQRKWPAMWSHGRPRPLPQWTAASHPDPLESPSLLHPAADMIHTHDLIRRMDLDEAWRHTKHNNEKVHSYFVRHLLLQPGTIIPPIWEGRDGQGSRRYWDTFCGKTADHKASSYKHHAQGWNKYELAVGECAWPFPAPASSFCTCLRW